MSTGKELIWVPKDVAARFSSLDNVDEQLRLVEEVIEEKRKDIKLDIESLDDNVLLFKATCLKHKQALAEAYGEQDRQLRKLWEDMGDISSQISNHVRGLVDQIKSAQNDIKALDSSLSKLRLYVPENLLNMARQVAMMDDASRELLRALLDHAKRE